MRNKIVYLSLPYTHNLNRIIDQRMKHFAAYAGQLQSNGYTVVSALYNHYLLRENVELPTTWKFWKNTSETLVSVADELHVLKLDGWETSQGVEGEIEVAKSLGLKIVYISIYEDTNLK